MYESDNKKIREKIKQPSFYNIVQLTDKTDGCVKFPVPKPIILKIFKHFRNSF